MEENKNMALSREEDDNQRKRDENNRGVERRRRSSRVSTQQALRRLNQLRAENKILEEKQQTLLRELRLLKIIAKIAGIQQRNIPKSVIN